MKNIFRLLFIVIANHCFSQINTFYVEPALTNVNYAAMQDSHLVVRNMTTNNNKLFLFIGGTKSKTQSYFRISEFAGNLGFDVINISYPNDVAAASLRNSADSLEFDKYRQEICFGTPISRMITVDTFNSIYSRTIHLLKYLNSTYPVQLWDQYLIDSNTLDWSKITIGGHSQGGGHAPYFAKFHIVDRVLMFSSPNDYSDYFSKPANWLRNPGVTPINKHFAYLSLLDEVVDFRKQLRNIEDIGLFPLYDTIHVDKTVSPFGNSHCLYTTQNPGLTLLNHNSPMKLSRLNNIVWEYMLTNNITSNIDEPTNNSEVLFYPNPTNSKVSVQYNGNMLHEKYYIRNINGQIIMDGRIANPNLQIIDFSSFENGIYFLSMGKQICKIIKE